MVNPKKTNEYRRSDPQQARTETMKNEADNRIAGRKPDKSPSRGGAAGQPAAVATVGERFEAVIAHPHSFKLIRRDCTEAHR
jgi:hypothetical protein